MNREARQEYAAPAQSRNQDAQPPIQQPEQLNPIYKSVALKLPSELGPVDKKMLKAEKLSAVWLTVAKLAH